MSLFKSYVILIIEALKRFLFLIITNFIGYEHLLPQFIDFFFH